MLRMGKSNKRTLCFLGSLLTVMQDILNTKSCYHYLKREERCGDYKIPRRTTIHLHTKRDRASHRQGDLQTERGICRRQAGQANGKWKVKHNGRFKAWTS